MSKQEKKKQLGMDPGTASNRLVKDLLWDFIVKSGQDFCFQCGAQMERDNFSIEHKEPWLHSEDPLGLFFDLDNISFSHHSCNCAASRGSPKIYVDEKARQRARDQRKYWSKSPEERRKKRREQYLRTGT